MNLKGSRTEKNLYTAISGEALAYLKYQIYAKQVGDINKGLEEHINETAHNEKEHGKIWLKLLLADEYSEINSNIIESIQNELHEGQDMYPEFARIAREEGFDDIADKFEQVADIEKIHAKRFEDILQEINDKDLNISLNESIKYKCLNCGYVHTGPIPDICPVCAHPKKYFIRVD